LDEEKEEFKYPHGGNDKSICYERFLSLLKEETKELLSDIKNYTNSFKCSICHKRIEDTSKWDYIQLYTKDQENFIAFHLKCAFKRNKGEEFEEFLDNFDYIYYINN